MKASPSPLHRRPALLASAVLVALGAATLDAPAYGARHSVTEEGRWERSYDFTRAPRLLVRNVWGSVHVSTHAGDAILVSAREQRRAASETELERLPETLWLEVVHLDDGLELTVEGTDRRHQDWQRCRGCELHVDLEIRVPEDAAVDVATVMDGSVRVTDVIGRVAAHNVNGDVEVSGVHQCDGFKTVNGELDVTWAVPPNGGCAYETVNGNMTVLLPEDAAVDAHFDLFNGDIRSEFDIAALPTTPTIEKTADGHGTRYKIAKEVGLRIGAGGPAFHFQSINGDVHLRRR